jgi:superfamily I DNA/RNA helicase
MGQGLTPEQLSVVDASIDNRLLVLAGAGTGKTYVLVERIRRIVRDTDIAPTRDLLVLSFSRAAVAELKTRIGLGQDDDTRLVRPLTFDSFATRLLARHARDETWREFDYDGRIQAATRLLATTEGAEAFSDYRHVFVDEIQDLVDVRAALVETVLRLVPGFTILGDLAQAIYDHNLRERQNNDEAITSRRFLESLARDHPSMRTVTLDENFRNQGAESSAIDAIGTRLRRPNVEAADVAAALSDAYSDLEPLGRREDLAAAVRGTRDRTGILCRSNIETFRISRLLDTTDVPHRLQRAATDRVIPEWLAILLDRTDRQTWSRTRIDELVEERLEGEKFPPADTIWRLLSDTVGRDDMIEIEGLRRRLSLGLVPDELVAPPETNVIVSTIHRAKGREFDVVYTVQPWGPIDKATEIEELRVMYVALSRAKHATWRFPSLPREPWRRRHLAGRERWIKHRWGAEWSTAALELFPDDVESMRPPGTVFVEADAGAVQRHLRERVRPGSPVTLELVHVRSSADGELPFYVLRHEGHVVGETSEQLAQALAVRLRSDGRHRGWPTGFSGATTDGIETVVGLRSEGSAAGLGESGLWLRPRLVGIADLGTGEDA